MSTRGPSGQAQRRSPAVRAYFERAQRDDPQRKKIVLVATAPYLVRVMWAMLRRGTEWQENPALATKPSPGSRGSPEANCGGHGEGEAAGESVSESA